MRGKNRKNFEELFMEAVNEGLDVLGKGGKEMVFYNLEMSCSIKREEIPKKPKALVAELRKIFGAGSSVLEKLIVRRLYLKVGLKYEDKKDYTFLDYLRDVPGFREVGGEQAHPPITQLAVNGVINAPLNLENYSSSLYQS